MAARARNLVLAMAVAAALVGMATAQSGCTATLIGLYPCLSYVTGNDTTPTTSCCTQLASVVQSKPECLCSLLGSDSVGGVTINKTHALELPKACKVQTPPVSKCDAAGGGSSPPPAATTPAAPAAQTPAVQTPAVQTPAVQTPATGSKATPNSVVQQANGGSSVSGPAGLVLALALAAAALSAVSAM